MMTTELRPQGRSAFLQYLLPLMVAALFVAVGWGKATGVTLLSGLAVAGCLIWLGLLSRRKASLTSERLDYFNGFTTRSVDKRELAGYRVVETRNASKVVFAYKGIGAKTIAFPLWIKQHPDAARWFADLTDLDAVDAAEAEKSLERDPAFGPDPESRLARAKFLSQLVAGLAVVGIGLAIVFSLDAGRVWAMPGIIALPLVALALEFCFPGQLRFAVVNDKANPRPALLHALFIPILLLAFKTLDLHFLHLASVLLWAVPVAAVVVGYIASRSTDLRSVPVFLGIAAGTYAYCFGALAYADVLYDNGARQHYPVSIIDLNVSHGRHTTYNVRVGAWALNSAATNFTVHYDFYANLAVGQTLCLAVGPGAFGWPWYDLETCPDTVALPQP